MIAPRFQSGASIWPGRSACSGCGPLSRQARWLRTWQRPGVLRGARPVPCGEDIVSLGLDAVEDSRVQLARHDHGETSPPRDVAHPLIGECVETARPLYLEAHQRDEAFVDDAKSEIPLLIPEVLQILKR